MNVRKLVGGTVSGECSQAIAPVCAMSTTGCYISPAFIFPHKNTKDYLFNNAPEEVLDCFLNLVL